MSTYLILFNGNKFYKSLVGKEVKIPSAKITAYNLYNESNSPKEIASFTPAEQYDLSTYYSLYIRTEHYPYVTLCGIDKKHPNNEVIFDDAILWFKISDLTIVGGVNSSSICFLSHVPLPRKAVA